MLDKDVSRHSFQRKKYLLVILKHFWSFQTPKRFSEHYTRSQLKHPKKEKRLQL